MADKKINGTSSEQTGRYLSLGLIPNFNAAVERIELDDFSIEKFDAEKIKKLFPKVNFNDFVEIEIAKNPYFVVFGELEIAPENEYVMGEKVDENGKRLITIGPLDFWTSGVDKFKTVILLLNLFHNNYTPFFVSTDLFRLISGKNTYLMHRISGRINLEQFINYDDSGDPYLNYDITFKEPHIRNLLQFKNDVYPVLSAEYPKLIRVALTFFYDGCLKELNGNEEMANLDYAIALESLFLTEEQELKYKFANRLAVLFGDTDRERTDFQKYGGDVYWLRSKVVHGEYTKEEIREKLSSQGRNLLYRKIGDKWVVSIREITRLSILYFISFFLEGEKKQEVILELIDKALFSESDRLAISKIRKRLQFLR